MLPIWWIRPPRPPTSCQRSWVQYMPPNHLRELPELPHVVVKQSTVKHCVAGGGVHAALSKIAYAEPGGHVQPDSGRFVRPPSGTPAGTIAAPSFNPGRALASPCPLASPTSTLSPFS